ncbi:hypothetical protein SLA2020_386170 [Shorea laevis]
MGFQTAVLLLKRYAGATSNLAGRTCDIPTGNGDGDCALSGEPEARSSCLVGWTRGKVFCRSWRVGCMISTTGKCAESNFGDPGRLDV